MVSAKVLVLALLVRFVLLLLMLLSSAAVVGLTTLGGLLGLLVGIGPTPTLLLHSRATMPPSGAPPDCSPQPPRIRSI
jgi:hypothetical protein